MCRFISVQQVLEEHRESVTTLSSAFEIFVCMKITADQIFCLFFFCIIIDVDWSVWNTVDSTVCVRWLSSPTVFILRRHRWIINNRRFPEPRPLSGLNGSKYFQKVIDCFAWIFIWAKNEMPYAGLIIVWYLQLLLEATQVHWLMPE